MIGANHTPSLQHEMHIGKDHERSVEREKRGASRLAGYFLDALGTGSINRLPVLMERTILFLVAHCSRKKNKK